MVQHETRGGLHFLFHPSPLDVWIGRNVQHNDETGKLYDEKGEPLGESDREAYAGYRGRLSQRRALGAAADKLVKITDEFMPRITNETRAFIMRFPHRIPKLLKDARKVKKKKKQAQRGTRAAQHSQDNHRMRPTTPPPAHGTPRHTVGQTSTATAGGPPRPTGTNQHSRHQSRQEGARKIHREQSTQTGTAHSPPDSTRGSKATGMEGRAETTAQGTQTMEASHRAEGGPAYRQHKRGGGGDVWMATRTDEHDWQGALLAHFQAIFDNDSSRTGDNDFNLRRERLRRICKHTPWQPFTACGPDQISHEALRVLLQHPVWEYRVLAMLNDALYTGLPPAPHHGGSFMDDTYLWGENPRHLQATLDILQKAPGEAWTDWNKRSLRMARTHLLKNKIERWSTYILRMIWGVWGHVARAGDITYQMLMWRGMHWWRQQQRLPDDVGARHSARFNSSLDTERHIVARDRLAWEALEERFIEANDPPWCSGKQAQLENLAQARADAKKAKALKDKRKTRNAGRRLLIYSK
ncbi:unnamed protein product [Symbiodinium sp. CCMP2592]|nr:unnamed protein product [Symbiodinium sp. CCMP2592]